MNSERWAELESLFERAVALEAVGRAALLADVAAGDAALARELGRMLDAHDADPSFLETMGWAAALPARAAGDDAVPARIGAYRVLGVLGRGGMGTVYLAEREAPDFRQRVALKVVRRGFDTDDVLRRFRRERQILANLSHPNIARVQDAGATADGRPYLVLEHIEGTSLLDYCDSRQLGLRERLALFRTICSAVHHAHQKLVVHRDLKPGNILVDGSGAPKLLDFGIAKLLDPGDAEAGDDYTRPGFRLLTPSYASPEQLRGEPVTTACDVWSLGALLFELIAGVQPYAHAGRDPTALERAVLGGEPAPASAAFAALPSAEAARAAAARRTTPAALRRMIAGDLDAITGVALRARPDDRFATVLALADDVRRHVEGLPVEARAATRGYRLSRFVSRHRLPVAAATLLATLLATATAITLHQSQRIREEAARVTRERDKALEVRTFLLEMFGATGPDRAAGESVTVREVLDRRAATIDEAYGEDPELAAELMTALADAYERLGLLDDAVPLARRALAARQALHGRAHADVAASLNLLGWLHHGAGEADSAEAVLREAVDVGRVVFAPPGDARLARALNDLGVVLEARSAFGEAADVYREALAMRRAVHGDVHVGVATTTSNLAVVLYRQGLIEEAAAATGDALELFTRALGDDHQRTIVARSNLAAIRTVLGDAAGAAAQHRAIADRHARVLGREDANTGLSLSLLAGALITAGEAHDAEPAAREGLAIQRAALGPAHPRVANAERVLGDVLLALHRYDDALAHFRDALDVMHAAGQTRSVETAVVRARVARAQAALGSDAAANDEFVTAVALFDELVGADHYLSVDARLHHAGLLLATGRAAAAAALLDRVEHALPGLGAAAAGIERRLRAARAR